MKRTILTMLFIGLITPVGLYAQKAYKDGNKAILDLTVAAGMPPEAVTNIAKYSSFTPSATVLGENNNSGGSINAKAYQKLEIAPHDLDASGQLSSSGGLSSWVNAFNYCKSLSYDGGGWRLPTQRELILIYVFKPALNSILSGLTGASAIVSNTYWTATENNATTSWYIHFLTGDTAYPSKGMGHRVRCVREVVD